MASPVFTLLRGAFAISEHLAPAQTGRAAFALFCRTPDPKRVSPREARAIAAAGPVFAEARRHDVPTPAGCVAVRTFGVPAGREAPAALVLHGWGSRGEHMATIVAALRDAGLRVVALDLPGHGLSAGRTLNLALAVAATRTVADWFGPFRIVAGHSFGGAVAINAMAGSIEGVAPVAADRLALVAAPSSMPAIFSDFSGFLGLGARTQMALADEVRRVAGRPLEDFVGADQLRALNAPTLVVHAPDDKEVPFSEALRFEAAGPHVTLMRAPGRGHRRILTDEEVARAVVDHAIGMEGRAAAA